MTALLRPSDRFRALHHAAEPLLLANAWDHASGVALVAAGCTALGTTSLGVAAALGRRDGVAATLDETMRLGRDLARLPVPVSVDLEGGFSDDPEEIAALVADLAAAGVAGVNLEDGRADGTLAAAAHQCEVISAVKARVPDVFLNARTDTFWLAPDGRPSVPDTLNRLGAYIAAGADGVFVPALYEPAVIASVVALGAPVNILYRPDRQGIAELAALGVRRISCGSLFFRAALRAAVDAFTAVRAGARLDAAGLPSYDDVQRLAEAFSSTAGDAPHP